MKNNNYKNSNNNRQNQVNKITAPYNFVPLNKEIFYPKWSNEISHDIPFKDAQSGEIDIEIISHSPIFIKDSQQEKEFCNYKGEFFIPASSIKGVVRNMLEIISFSKINLQNKKLSYRDLNNPSYKKNAMQQNKIYMGWLYKDSGLYKIDSLGKISQTGANRIKYTKLENYLGANLVNKIKFEKEAYEKYALVEDLNTLSLDIGDVVFTGSTGKKTREFLFPKKVVKTFDLDDELFETFKEAYLIDTINESKNWKYLWKDKFKKGDKIPIFFQIQDDKIIHFGLSMLYKLPYKNSLLNLVQNYSDFDTKKLDLAQSIFGNTDDGLKGRVYFSHCFCEKKVTLNEEVSLPLSSPRATFFPNYLVQNQNEQNKTKKYITYDSDYAIPRGHKFYPPQKYHTQKLKTDNQNILTKFKPLGKNSIFKGKIRFHNLKQEELGALLLSLTIMDNENSYHKIGMAKPYGFGTIKLEIKNIKTDNEKFDENLVKNCFIKHINSELKIDLKNHKRIQALKKLTSYSIKDEDLKYMNLKSFAFVKKTFNSFCLQEVVQNAYDKTKLMKNNFDKAKKNSSNNNQVFNNAFDSLKKK